jgi:hypothetical protein
MCRDARRGNFADASLDSSSIACVLDCHEWPNNSVRVTARNVSASTVDHAAAGPSVQVMKRRVGCGDGGDHRSPPIPSGALGRR